MIGFVRSRPAAARGLGPVLAALLVMMLALAPSLDKLVCREDAQASSAAASSVVAKAGGDLLGDHGTTDADICIHGHCHHGGPFVSAPVGELAALDALPDRHELILSRVATSDRKFDLERPPRA